MKKLLGKLLALALVLALSLSVMGVAPVKADEEDVMLISAQNEYVPYSWHPVVKDKVKKFSADGENGVVANCYYERISFVGFKKGLKKINKTLKKLSNAYSTDDLYSYAKDAGAEGVNDVYCDYVRSDVTYSDQKYVCVTTSREWYAGGVGNYFTDGYVFNLDTGKRVYITTVTGCTLKQVKNAIISAIKNDGEFAEYYDEYGKQIEAYVNGLNTKDINFGINSYGKVVLLIGPYTEPFFGGWTREYILEDLPCVYDVSVG